MDQIARVFAEEWCQQNPGWVYTGRFRQAEPNAFEVRQVVAPRDSNELVSTQAHNSVPSTVDRFSHSIREHTGSLVSPQDGDSTNQMLDSYPSQNAVIEEQDPAAG